MISSLIFTMPQITTLLVILIVSYCDCVANLDFPITILLAEQKATLVTITILASEFSIAIELSCLFVAYVAGIKVFRAIIVCLAITMRKAAQEFPLIYRYISTVLNETNHSSIAIELSPCEPAVNLN